MGTKAALIPARRQARIDGVPEVLIAAYAESNCAAAIFDTDGRLLHANEAMRTTAKAFELGDATLDTLAPEDRTSAAFVEFERFRAGRSDVLRSRHAIRCSSGKLFWADLSARRRVFSPGEEPLVVVQFFDVTETFVARAERERNDARWETALAAAGQGVWEHDATTGKLTVSQGWKRLRGIPDDEEVTFSREAWLERLHPDDRETIDQASSQQGRVEGFDTLEYRERHRDGHYIWIYSRGRPYAWDKNGEVLLTIGTDTDITRPKAIEAELALEKERLHVTLESIADGVISTDKDGLVTFINKAAVQMTGWTAEDALGQPIDDVFDCYAEGDGDTRTNLVAQCLSQGRVHRVTGYSRLKGQNGRSRYVREIASPVLSEAGAVIGAVMVFQDSTQRRQFQRQLEHSATHDALTGLANRTAFEMQLETSVQQAMSRMSTGVLCLIDLDKFKAVNDGGGHSAGDALLKEIAGVIRNTCRQSDFVARLGGDEFGLILNNCSVKMARRVTQQIIRNVAALRFTWQGQTFRVGASIGITAIDGTTESASDLYRNADNACYAAKRNGRGCEVVYG